MRLYPLHFDFRLCCRSPHALMYFFVHCARSISRRLAENKIALGIKTLRDYFELCKPRVVVLMLLTAWVGMFLASHQVVWQTVLLATVGIATVASSAAALNHWIDQKVDALMRRTYHRPIPSKRVPPQKALVFASVLGAFGLTFLWFFVNPLTAILTFFSLVVYAFFYSLYLKRVTPQNIVIGGLAGALPPLLGATAVTGSFNPQALFLVMIIFVWTPPHFWSLAIYRIEDYKKARIPMLPVTHGIAYTKLQILLYTLLLIPCSVLPFVTHPSGILYLMGALCLDVIFIAHAILLWRFDTPRFAFKTFRYSIVYLILLFLLLLMNHVGKTGWPP